MRTPGRRTLHPYTLILCSASLAILADCKGAAEPRDPCEDNIPRIEITLPSLTLEERATTQATPSLDFPAEGCSPSISWSSSNPGVASVNSSGVITGLARGTTAITASANGGTASVTITVVARPAASARILPASPTVVRPQQVTLTVEFLTNDNVPVTGLVPAWTSSNPGVATIAPSATSPPTAVATAVSAGTSTITAGVTGGLSATVTLTVTNPPPATAAISPLTPTIRLNETLQMNVTFRDANNQVTPGPTPTWTSFTPSIATISNSGLITGLAEGTTTINMTAGTFNALTFVTVTRCLNPITLSENFETGDPFTQAIQQAGGASPTATRQAQNGNPAGHRYMTHVMPSPSDMFVYHTHPATYSPASQGAIHHIEYSEDRIQTNPPFPGAEVGSGFLVLQGNARWELLLPNITLVPWSTTSRTDLDASKFTGIVFGSTGASIQFGYYRWNRALPGGSVYTTTHGIDNWTVRICR